MRSKGTVETVRSGNVIWSRAKGGTSDLVVSEHIKTFKAHARELAGQPWIRVTDMRDWELASPESMMQLNGLMKWSEERLLSNSINLVSNESLHTFALDKMMNEVDRGSIRCVLTDLDETFEYVSKLTSNFDANVIISAFYD